MYELTDEFKVALSRLKNREVIKAISAYVKEQFDGVAFIILKNVDEGQEDKIEFLIETGQNLDLFQLSSIASFIQEAINYEGDVIARPKKWVASDYASKMEKRILLYSEDGFAKLQKALNTKEWASEASPPPSYFFDPASENKAPEAHGDTVLSRTLRLMELAVADDPKNLEKIVQKVKELGSPTSSLEK
ncbi:MAG: hypothetical protein SFW07_02320 [Gammaproteobacteria bacterium]|nr:hypothetical protein [Gammaproteobacteria bacterium]